MNIGYCSFLQIKKLIETDSSLLVPVGTLEPLGSTIPIGAISRCTEILATAVSEKCGTPVAPCMNYAPNTWFKAYTGCCGMDTATFGRALADCCNTWFFHGFKRIMILTLAMDGERWIKEALKRVTNRKGDEVQVDFFSVVDDEAFKIFCSARHAGDAWGRDEWGIVTLLGYCMPEMVSLQPPKTDHCSMFTEKHFKQWYKRGRDPEKLKKFAPDAILNTNKHTSFDPGAGKELFSMLVARITERITLKR